MKRPRSLLLAALQSRELIELLNSKWRIPVLHLLTWGPLRTKELQSSIRKLSPKMLTQTLRGLERDGLILRNVHSVLPPRVEYDLTDMGKSVIPVLRDLCLWAEKNAKARDEARRRFDEASG
jgi:DNA-binding HxlR family transcriptional regulator